MSQLGVKDWFTLLCYLPVLGFPPLSTELNRQESLTSSQPESLGGGRPLLALAKPFLTNLVVPAPRQVYSGYCKPSQCQVPCEELCGW